MARRLLRILPVFLLWALASCNGNIGDLFSAFPASAFQPDEGGDGGDLPPGAFQAREVGSLASAQGVTGNTRNIAVATVGAQRIGFVSAGTVGVHVLDLTEPDNILPSDKLATISDAVLDGMPALLAGGACDDLAVVDNNFLVCIAVGRTDGNAVTVFHIPTLLTAIQSTPGDLSAAFVPGTGQIVVPGTPNGNAGGVSGSAVLPTVPAVFAVATGDKELGLGTITTTTPRSWTAITNFTSNSPLIDRFLDVHVAFPAVYAVVAQDGGIGLATLSIESSSETPTIPEIAVVGAVQELTGSFSALDTNASAFPGTFPATLTRDAAGLLYVSEQNGIRIYSLSSPTSPIESDQIFSAGFDIAGLASTTGFLARTNAANLTVYGALAGTTAPVATLNATGRRNLGLALAADSTGRYAFVCTNSNGLRIVLWSAIS